MNEFLKETTILNFNDNKIKELIENKEWKNLDDFNKIKEIYNYIRDEIIFGYNIDDDITASRVLSDGYGQCNTKGILFMTLLRGVGIPCRIHGFTVDKKLQKGIMSPIVYKMAPKNIFHSWVEVYLEGVWYELEGLILDTKYLTSLKNLNSKHTGKFLGYGVAVDDFQNPPIDFNRNNTYIQSKSVIKDLGIYNTPDDLMKEHKQEIKFLKRFLYRHLGRHMMNHNVKKIRGK